MTEQRLIETCRSALNALCRSLNESVGLAGLHRETAQGVVLAKAEARVPPSIRASCSSSTVRVGFPERV